MGVNGSNQKPLTPEWPPERAGPPSRNEYSNLRMGGPKTDDCDATYIAMAMPDASCDLYYFLNY